VTAALRSRAASAPGVDRSIRKEDLGHATESMTDHYTHIKAEAHLQAAESVARLVAGEAKETGS